jgi:predicted RNase H-like nuclease/uncharacterized protein YuzE
MIKTSYDPEADVLHVRLSADRAVSGGSTEVAPGVFVEFDDEGTAIGVEIIRVRERAETLRPPRPATPPLIAMADAAQPSVRKSPVMRTVLGIDAAWTSQQPSGVALVAEDANGWRLVAVASSYQDFQSRISPGQNVTRVHTGSIPDAKALLNTSETLAGRPVTLVAIDMPLSYAPITARRPSDDAVSRAYGSRKASTHTPSATRPGRISDDLTASFREQGYNLQTTAIATPGLIEVYPHPALIELASASERLRYKAAKARKYWPNLTPVERLVQIHRQWEEIVRLLEAHIRGVAKALGTPEHKCGLIGNKAYEDMLDAIVCAWVGICALEGRARPFGDAESAIWIPNALYTNS